MKRHNIILTLFVLTSYFETDRCAGQDAEPTAIGILQKYVQALGGEELLNSVTSMKLTAKQISHVKEGNEEGTTESTDTILVSDGRWVQRNSLGASLGFNGSRYWSKSKHGKLQWRDDDRYPFNNRDPVTYPLHLLNFPGTLEFAGKTKVGGKSAVRLKVKPSVSEPRESIRMTPLDLVFDAETGLLLQVVHEHKTVEFTDYRDVDGIMVPFQQKSMGRFADITSEHKMTVRSIEFNTKLEDALFVAPVDGAGK